MKPNALDRSVIDIAIRLTVLSLVIGWCLLILHPFFHIILWSFVLALVLSPLHQRLSRKLCGSSKWASVLLIFAILLIASIPAWFFMVKMVHDVQNLVHLYQAGQLRLPSPSEEIRNWPLIGDQIYHSWLDASNNFSSFIKGHRAQLIEYAKVILNGILSVGGSMLQIFIALIIAHVLLATINLELISKRLFIRLMGKRGSDYSNLLQDTVNTVVRGILGVAIIHAALMGLGFYWAGIPHAGLWTLILLVLCILQLPATFVTIPVIVYLFYTQPLTPAIIWTVYIFLAGLADNILKPILLSTGKTVPMLVIFLGVFGGFILSGFIGLFTGAVVLSIGYKLFTAWMKEGEQAKV